MYSLSDRRGHLLSQILTVAHIEDKIDEALKVGLAFREAYGAFGVECVCSILAREDCFCTPGSLATFEATYVS